MGPWSSVEVRERAGIAISQLSSEPSSRPQNISLWDFFIVVWT